MLVSGSGGYNLEVLSGSEATFPLLASLFLFPQPLPNTIYIHFFFFSSKADDYMKE